MGTRNKALMISGIIVLIFTIIVSALSIDNWNGVSIAAFMSILWAEVVFFGGLLLLDKIIKSNEKVILNVSYSLIVSFYSVLSIIVSIVFIILFKSALILFLIIQLLLIAIAGISLTVFISASKMVGSSNEKTLSSVAQVNDLIKRLEYLAVSKIGDQYALDFKKLSNDLRFTDISAVTEEDKRISEQLSIVEDEVANYNAETSDQKILDCITYLNSLISKRSISVTALKKGSI